MIEQYQVRESEIITDEDGKVPLTWWTNASNFGDLLSPYIFEKLSGRSVKLVDVKPHWKKHVIEEPCYIGVGSILSRVQNVSHVWGTGSFGTEQQWNISTECTYHAVRGPLTRSLIQNKKISCPEVYGDPALLMPLLFNPKVEKRFEVGVVLRWSDEDWLNVQPGEGVKLINLGRSDVEGVVEDMLACKRIVTSSLHGLIISDAYGIPNAWLHSATPKGGEFKFFDYFLSVNKVRYSHKYSIETHGLELLPLLTNLDFDKRKIEFSPDKLLDACPFLTKL